jgi:hypothetical protein
MAVASDAAAADLVALIHDVVLQVITKQKKGWPCEIVPGSWRPTEGTVAVKFPETNAIPPDLAGGVGPLTRPRYPVATTSYGRQAGPVGGEHGTIIPRGGKYVVVLHHAKDDSWGAQAGEDVYYHLNDSGNVDSWLKHTNDGPTAGDKLGGASLNGGAFAELRSNNAGGDAFHSISLDDTGQAIKITSTLGHKTVYDDEGKAIYTTTIDGLEHRMDDVSGQITHTAGNVQTLLDKANNLLRHYVSGVGLGTVESRLDGVAGQISHVVPTGGLVGLGALAATLKGDPTRALLSQSHLSTFETALAIQRKLDMVTLTTALQPFLNNGGLALAAVQALAALAHIGIPAGSSKVYGAA